MNRSSAAAVLFLVVPGCLCAGALAASLAGTAPLAVGGRVSSVALANGAHHAANPAGAHAAPLAASAGTPGGGAASPTQLSVNVTTLPQSTIANEPSLAIDSKGTIFVTGPASLQHTPDTSASPLWKSTDGGKTWTGPTSTETNGTTETGVGGADSDIVIGPDDSVYLANMWGGNTSMAVSTDHGSTFTQLPLGHVTPVDDRPWLYYDARSGALWMAWDGAGALHVGKALLGARAQGNAVPGAGPQGQLLFEQDVPAVLNEPDRGCATCPPGNVVVDPHGLVHVAFAGPAGVGVATSTDDGVTWPQPSVQQYAPGTGNLGTTAEYVPGTAGADNSAGFQVLRTDRQGNLYLLWSEVTPAGNTVVYLSYKQAVASTWHAPIRVSTPRDALFGTIAVVSPGNVDVAYYGSGYSGDPNAAPSSTAWDVYLAKVQNLFGATAMTTADVLPAFHHGAICTAGVQCQVSGADRRLGDFFSIAVDSSGLADIVTAADLSIFSELQFIHELPPPPPPPTPGPAFVLPQPTTTTGASQQQLPAVGAATGAGTGTGAASSGASAQPTPSASAAPGNSALPTKTTSRSAPKYANGVGISDLAQTSSAGDPGHGPSPWVYALAAVAATGGRFLLRRSR